MENVAEGAYRQNSGGDLKNAPVYRVTVTRTAEAKKGF